MGRVRSGVMVVVFGLVAVACGGGGGGDGGGEAATSSAPTVTHPPGEVLAGEPGCQPPPAPATSSSRPRGASAGVATLVSGTLTVGIYLGQTELGYGSAGESLGLNVDLVGEVARRLGLTLDLQGTSAGALVGELVDKKYDVAVSTLTGADAALAAQADLTDPYLEQQVALTVRLDRHAGLRFAGVDRQLTVGVEKGSAAEAFVRAHCRGIEVVPYESTVAALEDLEAERLDAVVNDFPLFFWSYPSGTHVVGKEVLDVVDVAPTGSAYVIAVGKDRPGLVAAVNRALAAVRADGTHETLVARWLEPNLPGGARRLTPMPTTTTSTAPAP